jgi:hypothetical protein
VRSRPPSVKPASASRSYWPLRVSIVRLLIMQLTRMSPSEGPVGSGVNGLTLGPLRPLGRLSRGRPGACRK